MVRIRVRLFATLREAAVDRTTLELADDARVADAWASIATTWPDLAPHREWVRAARNGAYAAFDDGLHDGDEVAFLPPVSGGARPIGLSPGPIDVSAMERELATHEHGAVVTFVGRARATSDDGRRVVELEYEAYPEMAGGVLHEIADEVGERWPGTVVGVVHRTGVVPLGEAAVAIVTAAPHRSAAYEANRWVIEAIKERLPIWKREQFPDGSAWKRPGA